MPWKVVADTASRSDDPGFDRASRCTQRLPYGLHLDNDATVPVCAVYRGTGSHRGSRPAVCTSCNSFAGRAAPPPLHATPHRPVSITAP